MRKIILIIVLLIYVFILISCKTQENVIHQDTEITVDQNENIEVKEDIDGKPSLTIKKIIKEYIPHPFNPIVQKDSLEYKEKWKGNVMPGLTQEMQKCGWELYDGMGAKVFYKRTIEKKEIKISILPRESGGPKEENATTTIKIELIE